VSLAWLVTGARGQLGADLAAVLATRPGEAVTALSRAELDLLDETRVRGTVREWLAGVRERGDRAVLLNAAAYTDVDAAEADEATAATVNGRAPGWLAEEMAGAGRLVHVSTDYVFDGAATRPYREDDAPGPRTAYGRTKLAGERAVGAAGGEVSVVRTAWLYGPHGTNFVRTMIRLERDRPTVDVVDDQIGSPTWSFELAEGLVALAARPEPMPGLLHFAGGGAVSWCGLARAVFEERGADPGRVRPTTSAAMARPAPRPAYSVLDTTTWSGAGLPAPSPWRAALRRAGVNSWD
jgi:dTDP-4-dehydrorhamnose reductase